MRYAESVGAQHFHASAKTGKNVNELYTALTRKIMQAEGNAGSALTPRGGKRGSKRGIKIE